MTVSNSVFIDTVYAAKKKPRNDFMSEVRNYDQFKTIADRIEKNTLSWGESAFGENKSVTDSQLSAQEQAWKTYFDDHSFPSSEDQRNLADALTILTGIDITRFIKVIKQKKGTYPAYIVIVPTGNGNGHSYQIGYPVLSFASGVQFYTTKGESGNNMTTNLKEVRLPTRDEIEYIILSVMYTLSVATEHLVSNLIERFE